MPRIRTIKPEYWSDEKLSACDTITRLVFLGLISQADDAGRLVDNVKLIDGALFPATDDSSRESIEILARLSRIVRYTSSSGQPIIQILNWARHQKVDHPNRHTLPAPTKEQLAEAVKAAGVTARLARSSRKPRENGAKASRDPRATTSTNDLRPVPTTITDARAVSTADGFLEFWESYPKRSGGNPRDRAERAWRARLKEGVEPGEIMAGLRRYSAWLAQARKLGSEFVMQAATFVGPGKRWTELWASDVNQPNGLIEDILTLIRCSPSLVWHSAGRPSAFEIMAEKRPEIWARAGPVMQQIRFADLHAVKDNDRELRNGIQHQLEHIAIASRSGNGHPANTAGVVPPGSRGTG